MYAYKAFYKNMKNRYDKDFTNNNIFQTNKPLKLRKSGYHCCKYPLFCLLWYPNIFNVTIYKIKILGDIVESRFTPKLVTNKFELVKKIF